MRQTSSDPEKASVDHRGPSLREWAGKKRCLLGYLERLKKKITLTASAWETAYRAAVLAY
jgi:hypothetical protein